VTFDLFPDDDDPEVALKTRRTIAETTKLEAEVRKLQAEADKLYAERRKNQLESEALHRWRWIAIPVGFVSLVGVVSGFLGAMIARH
jgi:hypothetical protein